MARTSATNKQQRFSRLPSVSRPRSVFDRTFSHKTTFREFGILYPFMVDEVLPGDTYKVNANVFGRLATPIHPLMDNMYLDLHFWYVPSRNLWDNFRYFLGEQKTPGDTTEYFIPQVGPVTPAFDTVYDYFGLPVGAVGKSYNALPFRAYYQIINEFYLDQDIDTPLTVEKGDGPDGPGTYQLQRRRKRKDYFTSARPLPQRGPGVQIPIEGTNIVPVTNAGPTFQIGVTPGNSLRGGGGVTQTTWSNSIGGGTFSAIWEEPNLQVGGVGGTINDLRTAVQLQRLAERDSRSGTRMQELLYAHWGVDAGDGRLDRPEFLGGGSTRIGISSVPQTSQTTSSGDDASPQGRLGGYGVANGSARFTKSFVEHGYIVGLASARADLTYQKGLERMWSKRRKYELAWPSLAHIGEQDIRSEEIFCDGTSGDDNVWGYQQRFAEYMYKPSMVTGEFRSNAPTPLDSWHLAQDFGTTRPTLNSSFLEENPPVDRVVAVPSEPKLIIDSMVNMRCVRVMPLYTTPGKMDHF